MKEENYVEKRQYFSLMEKVGSWNRYQFYLFLIFVPINIFDNALMFIPPLLFYSPAYECKGLTSEACTQFVCSLNHHERRQYLSEAPFHSLLQDFDVDFQCQHASTLSLFSMLVFVGSISGMLIFSTFTEKLGRKRSLALSLFIMIVGLALVLAGGYLKSIPLVIIAILLTYGGCENGYQYVNCFCTEVIAQEHRIAYFNALNVLFGLGSIVSGLGFFYIKRWDLVFIWVFLIPAVLTLLILIFFVEKTPLDMIASDSAEQILQRLERIAKINGKQFAITQQQIIDLKAQYQVSTNHAIHHSFTLVDLFSYRSLRRIIIPLMLLNFTANYLFYSPSVISNSFESDLFKQSIVNGASSSISVIVVQLCLTYITRRKANFILGMSAFFFLVLLLLEEQDKGSFIYSMIYFSFRLVVASASLITFNIDYESFPTQIRAVGSTFAYLFGNVSGIVQPYFVSAWKQQGWNVLYSFMVVIVLGLIPNYFIKETYGIPPPEIIQELSPDFQQKQDQHSK